MLCLHDKQIFVQYITADSPLTIGGGGGGALIFASATSGMYE